MVSRDPIPTFSSNVLQGVADVLGATDGGLTGSEIAHVLAQVRVPDVSPSITKRKRLFNALAARQNRDHAGNCVAAFIRESMDPVRHRDEPAAFARLQGGLNEVLVHTGLRIDDAGRVARLKGGKATTLDDADLIKATLTRASGPVLAINAGVTASDRSEQSGFANFVTGLLSLYRNPTAHDPKIHRQVTEEELLEALTAMSMVHRRLDGATARTQP